MPKIYRRAIEYVEAMQWRDTSESSVEIAQWLQDSVTFVEPKGTLGENFLGCRLFIASQMKVIVPPGSWIVKYSDGSLGSFPNDTFKSMFHAEFTPECKDAPCGYQPVSNGEIGTSPKGIGSDYCHVIELPEGIDIAKTVGNTNSSDAEKAVKDIQFWGDGDTFQLICKASSKKEGWMKSTKAMDVGTGVVVQVTTQQRNPDGSYAVAEALTFVHGAMVVVGVDSVNGVTARRIVRRTDV